MKKIETLLKESEILIIREFRTNQGILACTKCVKEESPTTLLFDQAQASAVVALKKNLVFKHLPRRT